MPVSIRTKDDISWGWGDELHDSTVVRFSDLAAIDPTDEIAQIQENDDANSTIDMEDSHFRANAKFEARYRRIICEKTGLNEKDSLQRMRSLFAGDRELKDIECIGGSADLEKDFNRQMAEIDQIQDMLIKKELYDPRSATPESVRKGKKLEEMRRNLRLAYEGLQIVNAFSGAQSGRPQPHPAQKLSDMETELARNQMKTVKITLTKPQMLINFLLTELAKLGAKKKGTLAMRPMKTREGNWAHAYEVWGDIDDVCMQLCTSGPDNALQECWLTSGSGNHAFVSKYIERTYKAQFPRLTEDRAIWAFPNGIFLGKQNSTFMKWGDSRLKETHVACKFFKDNTDPDAYTFEDDEYERTLSLNNDDWFALPTNSIQKVMAAQKGMKDDIIVQRWLYTHLGRMVWDLHELENWDVQIFYKGLGGTGKSTLLKEVEYFYQPTDVGVLGNEIEETFPLESLMESYIYLAFDVGESFRLSQMLWQCMVCCETVPIARKFKTKINKLWTIPGAMAGNQPPRWNDNGGSVSRRWVIWAFLTKVDSTDPWLHEEMKMETPIILKKCCMAYEDAATQYGHYSMKYCLRGTPYFQNNANQLKTETNLLSAFLQTPLVQAGEGVVPRDVLKSAFHAYCDKQRKERPQFTPDFYEGIFQEMGIKVSEAKYVDQFRGRTVNDFWIEGLTLEIESM